MADPARITQTFVEVLRTQATGPADEPKVTQHFVEVLRSLSKTKALHRRVATIAQV